MANFKRVKADLSNCIVQDEDTGYMYLATIGSVVNSDGEIVDPGNGTATIIPSSIVPTLETKNIVIGDITNHSAIIVDGNVRTDNGNDTFKLVIQKAAAGGYENDGGVFYFDVLDFVLDSDVDGNDIRMSFQNNEAVDAILSLTITRILF